MTSTEISEQLAKSAEEIRASMNRDFSQVPPRDLDRVSNEEAKRLAGLVSGHESLRDEYRRVKGAEDPVWAAMMEHRESPIQNRAVISTERFYGAVPVFVGSGGLAYLQPGWTLVRCHGEAHRSENENSHECPLCENAPWGWRAARK